MIPICMCLSLILTFSCFCGFFRDPYIKVGALGVEPETGILVQIIFEGELSEETSKGLRWDKRMSLAKSLFQLKFIISLSHGELWSMALMP